MVDGQEEEKEKRVVLTPPLSLNGGLAAEHRTPNTVQRILSLFRNLRPGSDLTHFQLPVLFNMPKSQLQCYAEAVYCVNEDVLGQCARSGSSLERLKSVVSWSISTTRPVIFGLAPFNPVLGETHHVSRGTLNIMLEQVSHHPPISALHAVDETQNIELVWCQYPVSKFNGTSVDTTIHGKRQLKLRSCDEIYEIDTPKLQIKLFPVPSMDWAGEIKISCKDSGLAANLCFKGPSLLGFGGNARTIKGSIFHSETSKQLYEIDGQWDRIVTLRDVKNGKISTLHDARGTISKLRTPVVKHPERLSPTDSAVVWGEVSQSIMKRDWERAREVKREIEERERRLRKERKCIGDPWFPKYFTLIQTKDGGWECWPKNQLIPPAPIAYD